MTTTKYVCDSCGAELEPKLKGYRPDQFWTVKIVYASSYGETTHASVEWCRPCLEKNGILVKSRPVDETPVISPSFEGILREIIREEIGN